jgi:hypothetical protein
MAVRIDLTLDCDDALKLAEFWKLALGYEDEPPPAPFATREEWLAHHGVGDDEGGGAWLHDPTGAGPRLSLLEVPEPKTAKNRLHIDIRVGGQAPPDERWTRILAKVDELVAAGASELWRVERHHVTMSDPEGNEFCVA